VALFVTLVDLERLIGRVIDCYSVGYLSALVNHNRESRAATCFGKSGKRAVGLAEARELSFGRGQIDSAY